MSIFSTVNRGARGAVRAGRKTVRTTSNVVRGTGRELVKEGMRIAKNWQLELIKLCVFIVVLVITIIVVYVAVDNQLNTAQLIQYEPDLTFSSKQSFLKSFQLLKTNGTLYDEQATNAANLTVPDNINLDKSLWTQYAYDRNIEAYNICAMYNNTEHLRSHESPTNPSKIFTSFTEHYNPFVVMSFISEWGGYTRYEYGLFPAIAYTEIAAGKPEKALDPSITIALASSEWYAGVLRPDKLTGKVMAGPLQIYTDPGSRKKNYEEGFNPSQIGAIHMLAHHTMSSCFGTADSRGVLTSPIDPLSFDVACDYYAHFTSNYVARAVNKNYEFKNSEQVVAFTSVLANTGPSFIDHPLDGVSDNDAVNTWPWKNNEAIFNYLAAITTPDNLAKIQAWAKKNYDETLPKLRDKTTNYAYNLQCNANEAHAFVQNDLNVNLLDYVNNTSGKAVEKMAHPVQALWCYYQLIWFYTGEE